MIVKLKDRIANSNNEPIMLVLEEDEKNLISQMGTAKKFLSYPEDMEESEAEKFMELLED